ncbi:MAG: gamma-glutamyl-gamma-aminobutyrate hydrolase family protein [Bacteroidaceae bacterium]|nr:gamma-glutamyl-gamma-aminobutyrate hydrolase family protein [Bacteroidaceae bacterium]
MKKKYLLLALLAFGSIAGVQAQRKRVSPYSAQLTEHYNHVDSKQAALVANKPLIGISLGYGTKNSVNSVYVESVLRNGGVPYLLPVTDDVELLRQIMAELDGIILTGGEDITPFFYGEEKHPKLEDLNSKRDLYDLTLFKLATDRNVPVLGICRGLQLINVAMGGTLYQDIPTEHPSEVNHRPGHSEVAHDVNLVSGSVVSELMGQSRIQVNSKHHQGIEKLAPGLKVTGWSPDSIPEIVEAYPIRSIMAVQFHPEDFAGKGEAQMGKLFKHLVDKAEVYQRAKDIHTRILSVDTHTDTPLWFRGGHSVGLRKNNQVSVQKMEEGKLDAQFLAAFLGQGERDEASSQKAVEKCRELIKGIYADVEKYPEECGIALTEADAWRLKSEGKKAFFIGIENGYAIGKDIKNIRMFKDMGVNYITLCHSWDNDICNSSTNTADASKGLTSFGRKVVKEMNKQGVLIDLSHASEGTFWDVMKLSKDPVFASHSGVKALCKSDRNLTDDQLRALAQNGGVIQICIFRNYQNEKPEEASIIDVVRHIDHAVKVAGIDHVGIGSDFDGGGGLLGCNGDNDMINITVHLLEMGYSEEDIRKIWGGNFFRILTQVRK